MRTPSHREYLLLGLMAFCWGSSFLAIKLAVVGLPPVTLTVGRTAIAALVMLLVMKARRLSWPNEPRTWAFLLLLAVTGNALPYALIAWAEVHVDSGLAAILIGAAPLMTAVLAHVFTADEKLERRRIGGVALGFIGLVALVGADALAGLGTNLKAQSALLLAALSYGTNAVIARHMPKTPVAVSAVCVSALAAALLFPLAVGLESAGTQSPTWQTVLALIWLGAVSTAGGVMLFFTLVASAGATFVSLANYLVPLTGVLLGALILAERPSWNALLALSLILIGIFWASRRAKPA